MGNEYLKSLQESVFKDSSFLKVRKGQVDQDVLTESENIFEKQVDLDEDITPEEILEMEIDVELGESIDMAVGGGMAGAAMGAAIAAWAAKKYRDVFGKANEACAKLGGKEGRLCRQQYKTKAAKAELSSLKYARSKCGQATDKKACLTKINARIKEVQNKFPETQFKEWQAEMALELSDVLTEEEILELDDSIIDYTVAYDAGKETGIEQATTTAAIVVAATALGVKAYKRFFSQAARACKGMSGVQKTNCMSKYKMQAQKAKVANIQKGLAQCAKAKNPEQCKVAMQKKISKEKAKLGAL